MGDGGLAHPPPRGLADFKVVLIISFIPILAYKYSKRLCYVVLLSLSGAVLISVLVYHTAPL